MQAHVLEIVSSKSGFVMVRSCQQSSSVYSRIKVHSSTTMGAFQLLFVCQLIIMARYVESRPYVQCCLDEQHPSLQGQAEASCVRCPEGSYCKRSVRYNTVCASCSEADIYNKEFVLQNCTSTSDTVIGCPRGYFKREIQKEVDCVRCSKCRNTYVVRPCDNTTDTVCCLNPGMEVVMDGQGAFRCGLSCGPGEYLDMWLRRCVPCPNRMYMPADHHNFTSCWHCFNYLDHEDRGNYKLKQTCDATHNEDIECNQGFYKRQSGDPNYHEAQCNYCSVCDRDPVNRFQVRPCDRTSNTVCCPGPNMKSRPTNAGYVCDTTTEGLTENVNGNSNFGH